MHQHQIGSCFRFSLFPLFCTYSHIFWIFYCFRHSLSTMNVLRSSQGKMSPGMDQGGQWYWNFLNSLNCTGIFLCTGIILEKWIFSGLFWNCTGIPDFNVFRYFYGYILLKFVLEKCENFLEMYLNCAGIILKISLATLTTTPLYQLSYPAR